MGFGSVVRSLFTLPSASHSNASFAARKPEPRNRLALFLLGMLLLSVTARPLLHAQTAYFAGAVTTLGGGFSCPYGVAVDAIGNVYVADTGNSAVKKIPSGCSSSSCVVTLGGGFSGPFTVAVDGSGNVYVADTGNIEVKEIPSGCTSSSCVTTLGGGWDIPVGVAVDEKGNVYVSNDSSNSPLREMPPGCTSTNYIIHACTITPLGGGFDAPDGLAVDGSGNVYVADSANNAVKEMPPGCSSSSCVATLGGGFSEPFSVALDGNGNIYVGDAFNNAVKEMSLGCTSSSCVATLGGGFDNPYGVAVDGSSNVYVADTNHNVVRKIMPHGVNFGTVAVGTTGPPQTLYFTFTSADSGITASALTQGAKGLDFVDAGTGTCDTNGTSHTYNPSDTCTVNVTFAPKYAGARYGAAVLSDAGGPIATAYIYGTGQAPQLVFPNSVGADMPVQALGSGFSYPRGVAVDGSGNVYVVDPYYGEASGQSGAVFEMPPGCTSSTCVAALGGNFRYPYGAAVDGAGNVYVADTSNNAVKEMPPGCTSSSCVTTIGGGFSSPAGVAVDGSGNVYVADTSNSAVKEMPPGCGSSSCATTIGGGFSSPDGVAVDGNGIVYVADGGNNAVKEIPPGCTSSSCVTTLGGDFFYPEAVAVDGDGDIYVGDTGNNNLKEMSPGCTSSNCVTVLGYGGFYDPAGLAVDGAGNIYVSDPVGKTVEGAYFATPPSMNFYSLTVGSQSGAYQVTLRNIGNASLIFPAPASGENPSVSANFTLESPTTCPEVLSSSSAGTLAAGTTCDLVVDFVPTTAGPITGSVVLTDNNLNASSAVTQSIELSGTGVDAALITPTVRVMPGESSITTAQSLSVGVAVSGGNGNPIPTGSVTLSSGTYTSAATTLTAGSANINVPAGQLAVGSDTLTATYTPDAGSSSTYNSATGTAPVTVVQAIGSCSTANPNPNPNPESFAAVGDFNGDCKSDILWRNTSTQQVYEWLMNGTTYSGSGSPGSPTSDWVIQGAGRFQRRWHTPTSCGATAPPARSTSGS